MPRHALRWSAIALTSLGISTGCALQSSGTAEDLPFEVGSDAADETAIFGDGGSDTSTIDTSVEDTTVTTDTTPTDSIVSDSRLDVPPVDVGPDVPTCDESACGVLPGGAKRLGLVDRGVACPPGYTSSDVVEELAGGNGCTCSCALDAPTCPGAGAVKTGYGGSSTCGTTGATLTSAGAGACTALGFTGNLDNYFTATAVGVTGGACTANPVTVKSAVSQPKRLCEPGPGACGGSVCASPFAECVEVAGACPAAYPNAHTVGSDVAVACPACTCTLSRGACSGTVDFFGGAGCTGGKITLAVNGLCVPVPAGAGSITAFQYNPSAATGASCGPSFSSAPGTRTVAGQRSLCCR